MAAKIKAKVRNRCQTTDIVGVSDSSTLSQAWWMQKIIADGNKKPAKQIK